MNRALLYLWFALLKRRALHFCRRLRRPSTLIGFAAVLSLLGLFFYHRDNEIFGQLIRIEVLTAGMLIMLGGAVFKGFLQRGLVFEPADVEFLFTGPFTQRQIIFYRLLPNYLFALVQALVFVGLFLSHLQYPFLTALCFFLFQIACFHVEMGVAIFAGMIPEQLHYRIRWIMLGTYFLVALIYLRVAWDFKIIPSFVSSPSAQLFFYPAVTLPTLGGSSSFLPEWALHLFETPFFFSPVPWPLAVCLIGFAGGAAASFWLLSQLKVNVFEASLATTTRAAEKRLRAQQGRIAAANTSQLRSAKLPRIALFRGAGAIFWKNLIAARRSRRELVLAVVFTLIYTGSLVALYVLFHNDKLGDGGSSAQQSLTFDIGFAEMLSFLAFLLQWALRFDFRSDGYHLANFRTLPFSPFLLVLAEIAVPTVFCLVFQALGMLVLLICVPFNWPAVMLMLLGYPAIALALNGVWNLHYLLSATKHAGGKLQPTALGSLMVVALSFFIFFPAGWTAMQVYGLVEKTLAMPLAIATWLIVQYFIDFLLVMTLAKMFQSFEISRDS